ncbi:LOW QUALITY PROTEIN: uncharacterized protein [Leptinotarsa decemlineata]|uniref:LOW QUALITY PROTEIN: uncharacterized protein n=1 Tax=Leptinotarsa decemlineata TaxID=7539 RepID=UPI003D30D6B4
MVRKRSRTSRKHYESDEPETDSDYTDDPAYEPAPKKYSLRQRKRTIFTEDFDYDDDGVEIPPKAPSDDEEYHAVNELTVDEAPSSEYVAPSTYINSFEPDQGETPAGTDELVDFEDMIRADIVVNKNRIDYDNVIQKTEIKVQPFDGKQTIPPSTVAHHSKPKSKRGRKPKRRNSDMDEGHFLAPLIQEDENDEHYHPYKPKRERKQKKRADGEIDSSLLEPETEVQEDEYEDKDDADYNPDDDLEYVDIANCMQTEFSEYPADNSASTKKDQPMDKNIDNNGISDCVNKVVAEVIPKVTECTKNATEEVMEDTKDVEQLKDNQDKVIQNVENISSESIKHAIAVTESIPSIDNTVVDIQSEDDGNTITTNFRSPTSQDYNISRTSENVHKSPIQVNGTIIVEDQEIQLVHKQEIEEIDDDVLVIEDKKCDVIILDD